jgi:hypothetical protein
LSNPGFVTAVNGVLPLADTVEPGTVGPVTAGLVTTGSGDFAGAEPVGSGHPIMNNAAVSAAAKTGKECLFSDIRSSPIDWGERRKALFLKNSLIVEKRLYSKFYRSFIRGMNKKLIAEKKQRDSIAAILP